MDPVGTGAPHGARAAARRADPRPEADRRAYAEKRFARRCARTADNYRDALIKWYGPEKGKAVKYAEVFEICQYGRQPSEKDLKRLFPFFSE